MKKALLISGLILAVSFSSILKAQTSAKADRVNGYYLTTDENTGKENSQIKIYKGSDGKYHGEIVWLKDARNEDGSEKLDKNNPDAKLKSRKLIGLQILKDFTYDAKEDEWSGGTIYNPTSGKTYNSYMRLDGKKMSLRGYIGKAWMGLGKTAVWTKEDAARK